MKHNFKRLSLTTRLLAFAFVLISSFACSGEKKTPPPNVKVTPVIQKDITLYEEFVGQTFGYADIAIRARVDGFLQGIHFKEGFAVKKGQLLYTIDPQPYEAKVAEALGRVAEAKTRMTQAKNDLERYKPLAEINAVSQKDLDAAVANYDAAKAGVEAANASLRAAQIQLGYTKMYAPLDGVIGKSHAKVGDYVSLGINSTVLNTVSKIDTILVEFFLPESKYLQLMKMEEVRKDAKRRPEDKKLPLQLLLSDGSTHDQTGRVNFINREVDANTGSILIQAKFYNPEGIIRPGQFAKIKGPIDELKGAMLIPQKSVSELQGKYSVFVVNDSSKVEYRSIEVGQEQDDLLIVKEGIKPGEKIIYEGLMSARNGIVVNATEQKFVSVNEKNN